MGLTGDTMIFERRWMDALSYFFRAKDLDKDFSIDAKVKNIMSFYYLINVDIE